MGIGAKRGGGFRRSLGPRSQGGAVWLTIPWEASAPGPALQRYPQLYSPGCWASSGSPSQVHLRGATSLSPAPAGLIPVPMGVSRNLFPSVQMLLCWTIGLLVATVTGEDAIAIPGEKQVMAETEMSKWHVCASGPRHVTGT